MIKLYICGLIPTNNLTKNKEKCQEENLKKLHISLL